MVGRRPRAVGVLRLIAEYYTLSTPPDFTAIFPIFPTWTRRKQASSLDESIFQLESSEDETTEDIAVSTLTTKIFNIEYNFQWKCDIHRIWLTELKRIRELLQECDQASTSSVADNPWRHTASTSACDSMMTSMVDLDDKNSSVMTECTLSSISCQSVMKHHRLSYIYNCKYFEQLLL